MIPNGFNRKKYNEILTDMQVQARESFGEDINLANSSLLGLFLQNIAWEIARMWELAEDVYFSSFVDYSEGVSLDGVGKYISISRAPATPARGEITVSGTDGTVIPRGFRVADEKVSTIYITLERAEIAGGSVDISVESVDRGRDQNLPASTLVKMVNPISGVDSITNSAATEGGRDVELDPDFRERYYRSGAKGGSSTRVSVEAALLDVEGVVDAHVIENDTMDPIGTIPPKSLAPFVLGGVDEDLARTILESKAGGIRSYGTTEVTIDDSKGVPHTIGFTRPSVIDIYVNITLSKGDGYPGDEAVTESVLRYIGGTDETGFNHKGLGLGDDVIAAKVLSSVMCLIGISDAAVELSPDNAAFSAGNIIIGQDEIAVSSYDKVVITYD